MITMALGGLWHGAAWNFVLWGLYQGTLLCAYRLLGRGNPGQGPGVGWRARPVENAAAFVLFFALTCYGWLLFRSTSLAQAGQFTRILLTDSLEPGVGLIKPPSPAAELGLIVLIAFELLEYVAGSRTFYRAWPRPIRGAFYALVAFTLVMGLPNEPAQFIYFRF
jgi:alginate O-acetyltransferase complex protein AlgI